MCHLKAAKTTQCQTPNNDIQQSLKVRIDNCTSALECLSNVIIIIAGSEDTNKDLRGKILYQRSKALVELLYGDPAGRTAVVQAMISLTLR
jgi:ferritin-like protein